MSITKNIIWVFILFSTQLFSQNVINPVQSQEGFREDAKVNFDVLLNYSGYTYLGKPNEFLGLGSGVNLDLMVVNRKGVTFGTSVIVHNNRRKKDYPFDPDVMQLDQAGGAKIGILAGKWIQKYHLSLSLSYVVQNIAELTEERELKEIQLRGFSPGVTLNYPLIFGEGKNSLDWEEISTAKKHINLHLSIRYDFLSLSEASGILVELGVGYRLLNFSRSSLF